jgi:hypothetical protein
MDVLKNNSEMYMAKTANWGVSSSIYGDDKGTYCGSTTMSFDNVTDATSPESTMFVSSTRWPVAPLAQITESDQNWSQKNWHILISLVTMYLKYSQIENGSHHKKEAI